MNVENQAYIWVRGLAHLLSKTASNNRYQKYKIYFTFG
jgi:hypothetical protein